MASVLVKPLGPDQLQVGVPEAVVDAVSCKDSPSHRLLVPVALGVGGGVGSTRLNGPTAAEGQLFSTT